MFRVPERDNGQVLLVLSWTKSPLYNMILDTQFRDSSEDDRVKIEDPRLSIVVQGIGFSTNKTNHQLGM